MRERERERELEGDGCRRGWSSGSSVIIPGLVLGACYLMWWGKSHAVLRGPGGSVCSWILLQEGSFKEADGGPILFTLHEALVGIRPSLDDGIRAVIQVHK